MADSLTWELHPEADNFYLKSMIDSLAKIKKLVQDVDLAVTRERRGRPWIVTRLHSSIPTLTIAPAINGTETVAAVKEGVRILTAEEEPRIPPIHFSEDALMDLMTMRTLFTGRKYRLRKIVLKDAPESDTPIATIQEDVKQKVERITRGSYAVLGSLEGTLEAANLRPDPPMFTVWERVTGRAVRCSFNEAQWLDTVSDFMKRRARVLVAGKITYFKNGMPRYISELREIRDMTPDESLPKGDFGSVPDLTGGKDSVEYLRSLRE
jgi:hypothetical protein